MSVIKCNWNSFLYGFGMRKKRKLLDAGVDLRLISHLVFGVMLCFISADGLVQYSDSSEPKLHVLHFLLRMLLRLSRGHCLSAGPERISHEKLVNSKSGHLVLFCKILIKHVHFWVQTETYTKKENKDLKIDSLLLLSLSLKIQISVTSISFKQQEN
ncbi:hypothetical protein Csa_004191 [Cucumis sativus]|nr:hypothetical protein Csa_004191 [Cucumis sativus]